MTSASCSDSTGDAEADGELEEAPAPAEVMDLRRGSVEISGDDLSVELTVDGDLETFVGPLGPIGDAEARGTYEVRAEWFVHLSNAPTDQEEALLVAVVLVEDLDEDGGGIVDRRSAASVGVSSGIGFELLRTAVDVELTGDTVHITLPFPASGLQSTPLYWRAGAHASRTAPRTYVTDATGTSLVDIDWRSSTLVDFCTSDDGALEIVGS